MKINIVFGIVLKKLRTTAGLSQEELARLCSLDRTFISLMERGQRQPSLTTIFTIAQALDITPSEMIAFVERHGRRSKIFQDGFLD
jgi:transcriptional regulator with XRE-family HTH domain